MVWHPSLTYMILKSHHGLVVCGELQGDLRHFLARGRAPAIWQHLPAARKNDCDVHPAHLRLCGVRHNRFVRRVAELQADVLRVLLAAVIEHNGPLGGGLIAVGTARVCWATEQA